MIKVKNIITLGLMILAGCRGTSPVSSNLKSTHKADSVFVSRTERKDSSFYKETVEQKKLEGATVGVTLTRNEFDSLIIALNALPATVPQQVQFSDPQMKAELTIAKDSLGRLYFACQAKDQFYFEKTVQQGHVIESLTHEVNKIREENSYLKQEVIKQNQTIGERLNTFIRNGLWLAIISGVLYLVFNFFIFKRLKMIKR